MSASQEALPLPESALSVEHSTVVHLILPLRDGEYFMTGSWDGSCRLFSPTSAQEFYTSLTDKKSVGLASITDSAIISVSRRGHVRVLSWVDNVLLCKTKLGGPLTAIAGCRSLGNGHVVVKSQSGRLWDLEWDGLRLNVMQDVQDSQYNIWDIAVHNGRIASISNLGQTVVVSDTSTFTRLATFKDLDCNPTRVALSSEYLVTGLDHGGMKVYNAGSFEYMHYIAAHTQAVMSMQLVPNSTTILSGSGDCTVALHDVPSANCIWRLSLEGAVAQAMVLPNGLVAACDNGERYFARVFAPPNADSHQPLEIEQPCATKQPSVLEQALAIVLNDYSVLNEAFVVDNIRSENVKTASDLLAGHSIILLAIRAGVFTRHSIRTLQGDSWYLQKNLYLPASKLTEESSMLLDAVFQHAENLRIIRDGFVLTVAREIRADVGRELADMGEAIELLALSTKSLENRIDSAESALQDLSRNLTLLHSRLQARDRRMVYVQVVRCMLSLVPLVGTVIGNAAYTASELFMSLTAEDLVDVGAQFAKGSVSHLANVDLGNPQVMRYVFSKEGLEKLGPETQNWVTSAINGSQFATQDGLEAALLLHIQIQKQTDPSLSLLDVGSADWISAGAGSEGSASSMNNYALEVKARKYFQYLTHHSESSQLTLGEAVMEVNQFLEKEKGLSAVPNETVETLFIDLADADAEEVVEEVFVKICLAINEMQAKGTAINRMRETCADRFRKRARPSSSLGTRLAARLLCKLYQEAGEQGYVKAGTVDENEVEEWLKNYDTNANGRIEEHEFLSAAEILLTPNQ